MIGVLNWYEEKPAWLAAAVTSAIQHLALDHLVAVDGAYAALPDGRASSAPEQAQAVMELCAAANVGCTAVAPETVWNGNEVEKRSVAFALAEFVADDGDWLFVLDADEVVTSGGLARTVLAGTDLDVGEARLFTREQPHGGFQQRKFFRAGLGWHLEGNHYTYVTADGLTGWCGGMATDLDPFDTRVEIEHRTRPADTRREQQQAYYRRRDEHGLESAPLVAA